MAGMMHEVPLEWLQARKNVIGASELADLLNCKEFKPRSTKPLEDKCIELLAKKLSTRPLDPLSFNEAARGHFYEPWAVEEYNAIIPHKAKKMYHWDDTIIVKNGLGFSPDAMDIEQPSWTPAILADKVNPTEILEIKCWKDEVQLSLFKPETDKMKLEPRFQIAGAMFVCPTIETAHLMFYDPALPEAFVIKVFDYSRKDLEKELEQIGIALDTYKKTAEKMAELGNTGVMAKPLYTEQILLDEYYKTLQI